MVWWTPGSQEGSECWEGAEQLGGRGCIAGSTAARSEVGAMHPERCQMIGDAPSHKKTPAARRALVNLTFGDMR